MSLRTLARLFFVLILLSSVAVAAEDTPRAVDTILKGLKPDVTEPAWAAGAELARHPAATVEKLTKQLGERPVEQQLAICYALLRHGHQRSATLALVSLMADPKAPLSRRAEAASLLGTHGGEYADWHMRDLLRSKELPDLLQVALAKGLWHLSHGKTAFDHLTRLLKSPSYAARTEATLALARFGRFTSVSGQLRNLATTPGRIGEEARSLLRLKDKIAEERSHDDFPARLISEIIRKVHSYSAGGEPIQQIQVELDKMAKSIGPLGDQARELKRLSLNARTKLQATDFPAKLIQEIMTKVRNRYAPDSTDAEEQEQLLAKHLANEAARALLGSIDPFNDYLDEASLRDMREQLESSYGGIGAWVGMRNGWFTILTPMYNKPAYKAGLRSMDVITKINAVDITKMRLSRIINLLKGPPKTDVLVTVQRKGWKKPRELTVMRDTIDIPSVVRQDLPGKIGYIKLTSFNEGNQRSGIKGTTDLLQSALEHYKTEKTRGLILDLTNNPGGLLQTAVEVCRKFLKPGKLIVYSKGKAGVYPRQDYYTLDEDPAYDGPLVVMVNSGSASAAEIVSGALKDHGRAVLVGQKTYGKGSVQQLIPLATTHGLTRLKLTIAKYYLPNDECIHKQGIEPHVSVEEREIPGNETDVRWKIRESRAIEKWLETNYEANRDTFDKLVAFDNYNPSLYPNMDGFVKDFSKSWPTLRVEAEMVRREYRLALRNHLRNNLGDERPVDIEENDTLQHALIKLGEMMPEGLPSLPVYEALQKRLARQAELAKAHEAEAPFPMTLEKDEAGKQDDQVK